MTNFIIPVTVGSNYNFPSKRCVLRQSGEKDDIVLYSGIELKFVVSEDKVEG